MTDDGFQSAAIADRAFDARDFGRRGSGRGWRRYLAPALAVGVAAACVLVAGGLRRDGLTSGAPQERAGALTAPGASM